MDLFKFQQKRWWFVSLMQNAFIVGFKPLNLEVEGNFY